MPLCTVLGTSAAAHPLAEAAGGGAGCDDRSACNLALLLAGQGGCSSSSEDLQCHAPSVRQR